MRRGFLPRRLPLFFVRVGLKFPRTIVASGILLLVIAAILGRQVSVQTDILSLVPGHNRVVREFKTTLERFGSVDLLLVVVRLRPAESLEGEQAYAEELARRLRSWRMIDWVEYRIENPTTAAVPLLDRATLFLGPAELDELLQSLDPGGFAQRAEWLKAQLTLPQGLVVKNLLKLDPFGLLPEMLKRIRLGGLGAHFDADTGYFIDRQRTCLLMLVKPVRPAQDMRFDRELEKGLKDHVRAADAAWKAQGWQSDPPRVQFAGGYITALDDGRLIVSDLLVGLVTSLVGVLLLFLIAFRRPAALIYAFGPLAVGLALTFIFVSVVLRSLNSATSAFAALLIGLGIDFVIVLYGRYVEERKGGASHVAAAEAMGRNTGVGVLLGAVTTAATFYAFLITDFKGLSDLGLLTGTGILLLVVTVFLLLPALLTIFESRRRGTRARYLHSFGSDLLCRASLRRPKRTLIAVVLLSCVLGAAAFSLRFDDDLRNMRSANNRGVILRQEIMKRFGLRFTPMMVRVDGRSENEALARVRRLVEDLRPLVDGKTLAGIDTIAQFVPSRESQLAVIQRLHEARLDPARLRAEFRGSLQAAGLNPDAFAGGLSHLFSALSVHQPVSVKDLKGTALARAVDRYIAEYPGGVSTVIYCYAPAGRWLREAPPALERVVAAHPGAVLVGVNVVSRELRRIVWGDAWRAAVLGLVAVFILLMLDLGGARASLLALVPLLLGMVWMLGIMAILGIEVNLMNIFVITMIIGIGVDYGVHLLHRWRESGGDDAAVAETSKAIAVASLTTVMGFGSLVLSHFPGLRSVGAAAILGATATAVLSITLLPVLLARHRS